MKKFQDCHSNQNKLRILKFMAALHIQISCGHQLKDNEDHPVIYHTGVEECMFMTSPKAIERNGISIKKRHSQACESNVSSSPLPFFPSFCSCNA